jgi:hypothetical protein
MLLFWITNCFVQIIARKGILTTLASKLNVLIGLMNSLAQLCNLLVKAVGKQMIYFFFKLQRMWT